MSATESPGPGWIGRGCPYCDLVLWEPPPEFSTERTDGGDMRSRVTWRTVLPHVALHVVTEHPETEIAAELLRRAAEQRARGGGEDG